MASCPSSAKERNEKLATVDGFDSITGKGVSGNVNGKKIAVGSRKLFDELDISRGEMVEQGGCLAPEGRNRHVCGHRRDG